MTGRWLLRTCILFHRRRGCHWQSDGVRACYVRHDYYVVP